MAVQGSLGAVGLPGAMRMLAKAGTSGILTVTSGENLARILLHDGKVVYATSTTCYPIGSNFLAKGLLSQEQLESVLVHQRRKKVKQPIGTILHQLGLVAQEVAASEIEEQILHVLQVVVKWTETQIHFRPVERVPQGIILPPCGDIEKLLLRVELLNAQSEDD